MDLMTKCKKCGRILQGYDDIFPMMFDRDIFVVVHVYRCPKWSRVLGRRHTYIVENIDVSDRR